MTPSRAPGKLGQGGPSDPAPRARQLDRLAPLAPNAWLRFDVVERMLPSLARDVLEIGCGRGSFGARLAVRYHYLGIEPDADSCQVARERLGLLGRGDVRAVTWNQLRGQCFDLVCAFEVLEHIEDDQAALAQWASLLRPGGWLMLSVPAGPHRFGPWDELVGHYRRYDSAGLARLLADSGLVSVRTSLYGFPLGYLLEPARNMIARRRLAVAGCTSLAERTAGSGRQLQPSAGVTGIASRWLTAPFRSMQRAFPAAGTGLVAVARVPQAR